MIIKLKIIDSKFKLRVFIIIKINISAIDFSRFDNITNLRLNPYPNIVGFFIDIFCLIRLILNNGRVMIAIINIRY